eukprot:m.303719 g.303719  ORF g.303719 m.303719 type:complete len:413 (+) comp20170_c0_seq7:103-1341(+)
MTTRQPQILCVSCIHVCSTLGRPKKIMRSYLLARYVCSYPIVSRAGCSSRQVRRSFLTPRCWNPRLFSSHWKYSTTEVSFLPKSFLTMDTATSTNTVVDGKDGGVVMMFVGQGAQTVGMTKDICDIPAVERMYQTAERVLGYDLKEIVLYGPEETLNETLYAQPALLIAGLAAVEKHMAEESNYGGETTARCAAALGLSVGEFAALVYAGALSFDDAISLVGIRAQAMSEAAHQLQGKMATVIGVQDSLLDQHCKDVVALLGKEVCISNFLFPLGRVVAGAPDAVDMVIERAKSTPGVRAMVKPLAVSGAFHTSLMAPAQGALRDALKMVDITMPRFPVISNTTGRPYTSPEEIRARLVDQIVQPVLWEESIRFLQNNACEVFYDMGPRTTLKTMLRKISPAAAKRAVSVDV